MRFPIYICHGQQLSAKWEATHTRCLFFVALSIGLSGCGENVKKSRAHMAGLQLLIAHYGDLHNEWPDSFDQIKERSNSPDFDLSTYLKNPLTGDDPGYEYVKPKGIWGDPDFDKRQIILYQLRDGERDTTLEVGYADLSIKPIVAKRPTESMDNRSKVAQTPIEPSPAQKALAATVKKQMTPAQLELGEPILNSVGMVLVPIPAGQFPMGSPDTNDLVRRNETPKHYVTITKPFYMGVHVVTQQQYEGLMGVHPWNDPPYVREGPDYPATLISWREARVFCHKLSKQEGVEYRLPTEAEWEYACRAGTTTVYSFGDDDSELGKYAWFEDNAETVGEAYAHRVGLKRPNPWGLYDMHGNAFEWCQDWFAFSYGSRLPVTDPVNSERANFRTVRGGSYFSRASSLRSAARHYSREYTRDVDLTFRVVREFSSSP